MKQLKLMSCFVVAGFLIMTSMANSESTQLNNQSPLVRTGVNYSFDNNTCTLTKSFLSDSIPIPNPNILDMITRQPDPDPTVYRSAEELEIHQNMLDISKYHVTIEEENQSYIIDVAINVADGIRIHLVQSEEDFINNSSTNVESIELQWMGNDGRSIELTSQEVKRESILLVFKFTETANDCIDFLTLSVSIGEIPKDKIVR